jgi:hypothetical protein
MKLDCVESLYIIENRSRVQPPFSYASLQVCDRVAFPFHVSDMDAREDFTETDVESSGTGTERKHSDGISHT